MQGTGVIGAILLAIGTTPVAAATPAGVPNLAACPKPDTPDGGERERTRPLPVPAALRHVIRSDLLHYAVATLGGDTVCIDTSWMNGTDKLTLSPDGRFLSFDWQGYEAYGHMLVDRTGKGQALDTGVTPVFSPSGNRLAAIEISESGFGSLNAFAVWRLDAAGIREIGRVEDLPSMSDWRLDRWVGENCVALSALPFDAGESAKAPRKRYAARPKGSGWSIAAGTCPSA